MAVSPASMRMTVINVDARLDAAEISVSHSEIMYRGLLNDANFQAGNGLLVGYAAQGVDCSAQQLAYLRTRDRIIQPRNTPICTWIYLAWLSD
ncbi:hypothetical protein AMAG_09312 [Allomyces macrogynus ATCC 38327]|uniref:Uncharacterized protein n=1 Tax=Allomyces macrogynus (strain ATCC 38327) TaxID=578462 RepID=A0A0L0SP34_ALLM3|nr:hypothetical protein AMAG_09312 [Allomyces macrogynus ATCC 38327]|eukprot:KNE64281.1 hypothetical protein AMAG_09312 [Allomyces macrogynus ATCC 38327]